MRIKVINPNTTLSMTERIGAAARRVAAPGTAIVAVNPSMGPASIESHYDEALSVPGLLEQIRQSDGADGFVVACFGDPGLDAARETAAGRPVVGIAQAAMHVAALTGRSFSVITTLSRTTGRAWDLARTYGFERACRNVHACDIPVLELDDPSSRAASIVEAIGIRALSEDNCDALVLGCAGMVEFCGMLSARLGVPVVDGVAAATVLVESMVRLGVQGASRGEFAPPPQKAYSGLLREFRA